MVTKHSHKHQKHRKYFPQNMIITEKHEWDVDYWIACIHLSDWSYSSRMCVHSVWSFLQSSPTKWSHLLPKRTEAIILSVSSAFIFHPCAASPSAPPPSQLSRKESIQFNVKPLRSKSMIPMLPLSRLNPLQAYTHCMGGLSFAWFTDKVSHYASHTKTKKITSFQRWTKSVYIYNILFEYG